MMNLLKQQERRGKIPAGVPEGVIVANKTGELDYVENDAAVVFRDNCPYILCVMSENVENASVARQTIVNISSDVYSSIVK
jgi:beta-lactamase class A